MLDQLSIVLPAYNEAEALPKLVHEINQTLVEIDSLEVIIVNDGSQDHTSEVMQDLVQLHQTGELPQIKDLLIFDLPNNQGMGAALKVGFTQATMSWVTFLPGDGQIAASEILVAAEQIQPNTTLISTAYHNREYNIQRLILSKGLRLLSRFIVGVHIISEGMYLIKREVLQQLPLHSDSFMLNLEIPIRCKRLSYQCELAHIAVRERQGGISSATRWGRIYHTLLDLIKLRVILIREKYSKKDS